MFEPSQIDSSQINQKGISNAQIQSQIEIFKLGAPFVQLQRACIPNDGIKRISSEDQDRFIGKHKDNSRHRIMKFVPASGAASRMFQHLHSFRNGEDCKFSKEFIKHIQSFPFYKELDVVLNHQTQNLIDSGSWETIFKALLSEDGLNYGSLPKALISFHPYQDQSRKALEEHLVEAAQYGANQEGVAQVHFTLSGDHIPLVKELLSQTQGTYEEKYGVLFDISYSVQKESTDTIAVQIDNTPFRKADGTLLFRPGGHGALIENLNDLNTDIAIIKNIDNVCREEVQAETWRWKAILSGYVMHLSEYISNALLSFNKEGVFSNRAALNAFVLDHFKTDITNFKDDKFFAYLNRPLRVCGMVKNEGEPGGGPFWVEKNGKVDCQIVEKAQIDMSNHKQAEIVQNSTHFNPVDLVCKITDFKGDAFDLRDYRDMETVFISKKSLDGQALKALELPGLWNGAMANWLTVFVEVPLVTFNPVKTVNDLLKKNHLN